jgi:enoyl reductase-like protein
VLVSTTTELDDYIIQTETQSAESRRLADQAAEDVRTLSDKRTEKLMALSDTAKMMVETASSILEVQ